MPEVVEIPIELTKFQLPEAVHARLQFLLDCQDSGHTLVELIAHRISERRRDAIALNIMRANEDYSRGQVFRGSVADIMVEL